MRLLRQRILPNLFYKLFSVKDFSVDHQVGFFIEWPPGLIHCSKRVQWVRGVQKGPTNPCRGQPARQQLRRRSKVYDTPRLMQKCHRLPVENPSPSCRHNHPVAGNELPCQLLLQLPEPSLPMSGKDLLNGGMLPVLYLGVEVDERPVKLSRHSLSD